MVQTLQAKDINLRYLIDKFGLQLLLDDQFFWEWQDNLPESTDLEKQLLDKVKAGYFNFINYPLLLEDVVRMAIVAPILFIGDFYLTPFYVKSEEPINIAVPDDDVIIKGRIDTLLPYRQKNTYFLTPEAQRRQREELIIIGNLRSARE